MTIEDLCDLSPDKLLSLSPEELDKILSPYYHVTRPEQVKKTQQTQTVTKFDPKRQAVLDMMASEGYDLSFLRKRK